MIALSLNPNNFDQLLTCSIRSCKKGLPTRLRKILGYCRGNLQVRREKMSNENKGWRDISTLDNVIVPGLAIVALIIYFIASSISLHG
jgi:hypothetical protein